MNWKSSSDPRDGHQETEGAHTEGREGTQTESGTRAGDQLGSTQESDGGAPTPPPKPPSGPFEVEGQLQGEVEQLQKELENLMGQLRAQVQDNDSLSLLNREQEERLLELEWAAEHWSEQAEECKQILESMQSDRTTISRALSQNRELKEQFTELQNHFIRLVQSLQAPLTHRKHTHPFTARMGCCLSHGKCRKTRSEFKPHSTPKRPTRSECELWNQILGPVKFCCFSPDGRLVASSSSDCTIRLWDVAKLKCLHVLIGHQRSVETVSFSPDSKQLASGGWDRRVILWEVQSGHNVRLLVGHRDSIQSSDFSPNADSLATGSWDSTVHIWDLRVATPAVSYQELEGHTGNISCLCYSASGLLASGSWDKTIRIWKPTTSSLLFQLKGHATWVKSLAFSPDELRLASAGYSHTVKVWDCNTGECLDTLKGLLDVAHACVFTPDGKLLVSGAADVTR
ncbi:hypothetical protein STEG23_036031 [Scotinomys teguina]